MTSEITMVSDSKEYLRLPKECRAVSADAKSDAKSDASKRKQQRIHQHRHRPCEADRRLLLDNGLSQYLQPNLSADRQTPLSWQNSFY